MDPFKQSIFCTVTFHYRPNRLRHLTKILYSLANFMNNKIDVVVILNAEAKDCCDYLELILKELSSERFSSKIYISQPLSNPWHLTWVSSFFH